MGTAAEINLFLNYEKKEPMSEDKATTFVPSKFRVLHSWRSTGKGEGETSTELFPDHAE